ncbi:two-component system sensor histidine kinase [Campylobacter blaseri]|uniref:histidine kinase n=1 Tax=Campylobacter blaseri TaxID=2042961 RepID=A0A2P8QYX5_9BACT|nr:sensor histidine kinase [Campylobacter blaseri]PSM51447.1 two-component sensor histidine kinase [Campylobacter blaseri]PSM52896.1 two-component sensor histidine kinase [Campylobacter blaseri]QKF86550.1 two-component system sensor histidine kinase [Campylobacter blaseri]
MPEIEKLSKEHKKFGFKLFLSYITFTILLIISITIIHIHLSNDLNLRDFEREAALQSSEKKKEFDTFFKKKADSVLAIAKNEYFLNFIEDNSYEYYIDLLLLTIMDANKDYMQLRFLDKNGVEKIRFERDNQYDEPYKNLNLQDKSNRYYFTSSKDIPNHAVWFSPIDLNIEHGKIEKPNKAVARVATPIYIKAKFQGILIINIFIQDLLESITKSTIYDMYITDMNGYYIKHKNKEHDWSFYDSKHRLEDDLTTKMVENINKNKQKAKVLSDTIYIQPLNLGKQKLNLLLIKSEKSKQELTDNNNKMVVAILIFSFFMSIIFSMIFSSPLKKMYEIVVLQAQKLRELAINLDKKVQIESLKNAKKDRLLQHQNKLVELGDMIGNIAHQWRHPITRLSLTLQNLKEFQAKGKLKDELLEKSLDTSMHQIEFMSNTIDNFKDFYRSDTVKKEFFVQNAIDSILKIIGPTLKHNNIKINIYDKQHTSIYGNKNEFSQVLMNLIVNSKDAFVDKQIKSPNIDINIEKINTQIQIQISDNAGGIDEKIIPHIFDPYFTTKEKKGTGIGLYLAKAIIEEKMQGKILVQNRQDGVAFTIILKQ